MSSTLESLQRRKKSAGDLALVVRTMKAMALSNITQYEMAVNSLQDYSRTIMLGMYTLLRHEKYFMPDLPSTNQEGPQVAIVFGSDQGLVGPFNNFISSFTHNNLHALSGKREAWAVGERIFMGLKDDGLSPTKLFHVPNSVAGITPLVNTILMKIEEYRSENAAYSFLLFHNSPLTGETYQPKYQRLFPVDQDWEHKIQNIKWPSNHLPQIIGNKEHVFRSLFREHLFVSIYKACAESLASENASRLAAMQRAEKNIQEIQNDLQQSYNRLRQSMIDDELFDVIAGFEALKKEF
jgi:F-type H+-transporting ATPase subunit gamma